VKGISTLLTAQSWVNRVSFFRPHAQIEPLPDPKVCCGEERGAQ
jgi:hypothetical protein